MPHRFTSATSIGLILATLFANLACSSDPENTGPSQQEVVDNYAVLVAANYADALAGAEALHGAAHELTETPSTANLKAARKAWLDSRDPYGESEAFRFYDGPIDNAETGPEGLMNAWPIDESYIDYVLGANDEVLSGGIINLPDDYPVIDEDTIIGANEAQGETSISTGYHAIEFLLWGQDHSVDGPGDRPYTDFDSGPDGTAENQDRRSTYLLKAADLLVSNLTEVHAAWAEDKDNYRAEFVAADPKESIGKMLVGMGSLAGAELSGERMRVAYDNKDQENEHSCFSDNTLADLRNNALSVQNVLLGNYGELDGPGIDDLVEAKNPRLAQQLRDQIQSALDEIAQIPGPFDQAILGDDDSEGRVHIDAAITSLQSFKETLLDAAAALNISLELE